MRGSYALSVVRKLRFVALGLAVAALASAGLAFAVRDKVSVVTCEKHGPNGEPIPCVYSESQKFGCGSNVCFGVATICVLVGGSLALRSLVLPSHRA